MKTTSNMKAATMRAAVNDTARELFPQAAAMKAKLKAAERKAAALAAKAERLTAAALVDDADRADKAAAKAARAAARAADDAAENIRARLALADVDALTRSDDIVVSFRERTPADDAAADARKAYAAARADFDESGSAESRAAMKAAKAAADAAAALADAAAADAPRYAFTMGAPAVNERYPAAALRAAYMIIDSYTRRADIVPADTFAAFDIFNDAAAADALTRSARTVAKRAAVNCILRQGTPTQWAIYNAACAGEWEQQDISELQQTAALALWESRAAAPALDDIAARADALRAARKAAFVAINDYLSSMRAIRADAHAARDIPLETVADDIPAPADDSEYRARRADIIRRADTMARDMLTPAEKRTLAALVKMGGNERAAARALHVYVNTIEKSRARIAGKYAAAVDAVAGDSIELHALTLAALAARADAAAADACRVKRAAAENAAAVAALVDTLTAAQKRAALLIGRGATYRAAADAAGVSLRAIAKAAQAAAEKLRAAVNDAAADAAAADILRAAVAAYDAAERAAG